jgi:hypothetical protein
MSDTLLQENERLAGTVAALHEQKAQLESRVRGLEETNRDFTERHVALDQLNAHLANQYVALHRLHGSLERSDVLDALREILINLIGTENFAVFERQKASSVLRVAVSFGVDEERLEPLSLDDPGLGAYVAGGETYLASQGAPPASLSLPLAACVPLRIGDRVIGAIVVYELLAHKAAIEEGDVELFNLLAMHAATALYCSDLHARATVA